MFPRPWLSHPQVGGSRHLLRTPTAPRHTRAPPVPEGSGRRRGAVRSAFSPAGALHLQAANPGRHLFKQKRGPRAPPVQRTRGASRLCPEQDAPALVAPLGVRGPRVGTPAARSARCPPPREPHPPRRRWPPGGRPAGSGAAPTPWRCAADPRPARARGVRACARPGNVRQGPRRPGGGARAAPGACAVLLPAPLPRCGLAPAPYSLPRSGAVTPTQGRRHLGTAGLAEGSKLGGRTVGGSPEGLPGPEVSASLSRPLPGPWRRQEQ